MKRRALVLGWFAVVLAWPPADLGASREPCAVDPRGASAQTVASARFLVAYRTRPQTIAVGEHFALDLTVCPRGDTARPDSVRVDAYMPEHRHGMNYRPSVTAEGDGRYRAEGLLFHMPGRWEFIFEVRAAGQTDRLVEGLDLE